MLGLRNVAVVLAAAGVAHGAEIVGRLQLPPEPDSSRMYTSRFERATGPLQQAGIRNPRWMVLAYVGVLRSHCTWVDGRRAAVAIYDDMSRHVFVDVDRDGWLSRDEGTRVDKPNTGGAHEAVVWLPHPSSGHAPLPLLLRVAERDELGRDGAHYLAVSHSGNVRYRGSIPLGERRIAAVFDVDGATGMLDARKGRVRLDLDGDAQFSNGPYSLETVLLRDEDYVFRAGSDYFSLRAFDVGRGSFQVERRAAGDYSRIELRRGVRIPDFAFLDINGQERRLGEFAGNYVLLDFWGTWCEPCRAEAGYLVTACERLRERGLVILGMNWDDDVGKAQAFADAAGMDWAHARKSSIEDLVLRRLRVTKYPTHILLDREGRIVSTGRAPDVALQGGRLLPGLRELIGVE